MSRRAIGTSEVLDAATEDAWELLALTVFALLFWPATGVEFSLDDGFASAVCGRWSFCDAVKIWTAVIIQQFLQHTTWIYNQVICLEMGSALVQHLYKIWSTFTHHKCIVTTVPTSKMQCHLSLSMLINLKIADNQKSN